MLVVETRVIRNEGIREKVGVALMMNKMQRGEAQMVWAH